MVSLFKVNRGNEVSLPAQLTDGWVYFCMDTGSIFIDCYNSTNDLVRSKISAEYADKLRYVQNEEIIELTPQAINTILNNKVDKIEYNTTISGLGGRISDVENDIKTTNEELEGISQDFEDYQTTNNDAVATNSSNIERNKTAIEVIQGDYLTSTDRTQIQDNITQVSNKAIENTSAIEILNGNGVGSVQHSIDNAFNEFAANITNDEVVNTYKELIDYAATHNSEFVTLVGEVDNISKHIGEVESDFVDYQTEVEERFTETDTTINNHATNIDNPHGVTKEQIGLANVDDTSDIEKPISYATQEALDGKAAAEHEHNINDITSGVLGVEHGGSGYASIIDNAYSTPRYRASALVSYETAPYDNGTINWVYE